MSPPTEAGSALTLTPSHFPPLVETLGEFFASRGTPAYLVGGVVRDALLGRQTGDLDLAVADETRGVGAEIAELLGARSVVLDQASNLVRVVSPGNGAGPVIDLNPIQEGILSDLSRRDFTLDAMAVSLSEAWAHGNQLRLIDPHHGTRDLQAGVIRALSPSVFTADAARLLRAPRLAAQLHFSIAEETADSIRGHAPLLTTVAPERVRDEFLKLLAEPYTAASLRLLDGLGLLDQILPELAAARGVTQPKEHHWDVYEHSIETAGQVDRLLSRSHLQADGLVAETMPRFEDMDAYFSQQAGDGHTRLTMLKLAGLLHDIAKPATRKVDSSGRIRFLGHDRRGAQISTQVLDRLRFSRRGADLVSHMVEHHLRPSQMAQGTDLPTSRAVYRYFRDVGDAAIDTLYLNMADYLAARGPQLRRQEWAHHCGIIEHILRGGLAPRAAEHRPRLIDGHDIKKTFSLPPGPTIGRLLELVRESQATGEIVSREQAIQMVRSILESGGGDA